MQRLLLRSGLWIAGLSWLAACSEESAVPGPTLSPSLVNLGLVAQSSELAADGDLVLVAAREFEAGGRDLNLDGDAFDLVVFVVDLATGTTRNTALALDVSTPALLAQVRGHLALFAASEQGSGARDLNGDGDADDAVLFVHDANDDTTRSMGLALSVTTGVQPGLGGDLVAFVVSEADQGQDLDGDGSANDDVLHVYDAATRALLNTGIVASSRLFVEDGSVSWFAGNSAVLQVFDVATRTNHDSGLATDGVAPVFAAGTWMVAVPEAGGVRDLDGDGALASSVLHVFEPSTGLVRNLGLACVDSPCAVAVRGPVREQFALRISEADGDHNGDGDRFDLVLHLYDPLADRLRSSGIAAVAPPVVAGRTLGFLSFEPAQGADLDGDGLQLDAVAFTLDAGTGVATNLRQEALDVRASDGLLLLARRESAAEVDWNQDGDRNDVVVHVFAPQTGRTINTRLASADAFDAGAGRVLLAVDEAAERADLNSDHDQLDQVFVLFELASERAVSVGLASGSGASRFGRLTAGGRLAFLANEFAEGRDLNGDGDLADDILHRGR